MTQRAKSSVNDLLQEHLLPQDDVAAIETVHGGIISLIAVGRYGARLEVNRRFLEFKLEEPDGANDYFTVREQGLAPQLPPEVLALAWHRAAEAIRAVRKGHDEYNRRRTR